MVLGLWLVVPGLGVPGHGYGSVKVDHQIATGQPVSQPPMKDGEAQAGVNLIRSSVRTPMRLNSTTPEAANRAEAAIAMLSSLPFAAEPSSGIGGGAIKATPGTLCGRRDPALCRLWRRGACPCHLPASRGGNTADAARIMQKHLGLAPSDVGWGGRKDKWRGRADPFLSLRCQSSPGRGREAVGRSAL